MNPLKALFQYVFPVQPSNPSEDPADAAFEWNPEDETVARTSARDISWKRETEDKPAPRSTETPAEVFAAAHSLPTPTFERTPPPPPPSPDVPRAKEAAEAPTQLLWNEGPSRPAPVSEEAPFVSVRTPASVGGATSRARSEQTAAPSPEEDWVKPSLPEPKAGAGLAPRPSAQSIVPTSDFEDVYRKAGIKSPVHGYGVERVYRLLTSRRLVGLDRSVKRSALLTALDAAGVPPSDVSQDAVLRRKALTAYEAEKALELQSLRSRNESRAEALQDTVETFTRQKQSQIERLAQGSTNAVRAQSDLEIRKRMEQDRLFRSLAYFVEPLPSPVPASAPPAEIAEEPPIMQRFEATIEMMSISPEAAAAEEAPVRQTETIDLSARESADTTLITDREASTQELVVDAESLAPPVGPDEDDGGETQPLPASSLEMALKAAAEEARTAGWGRPAVAEDSAENAAEALRKLRETNTGSDQ